jgi:lysine 2,3-aminomutase
VNSLNRQFGALKNLADLEAKGLVTADEALGLANVVENFNMRITPHVQNLIELSEARDPIYVQYVPSAAELVETPGELVDPIGDDVHEKIKGITHRYPDRVLLKATHTCQVYCRFCFRREKVGQADEALNAEEIAAAIDYIRNTPEIWEVILSGGDPLVMSDRRLALIMRELSEISHVQVIRIHTRAPVADPARIGDGLIAAITVRPAVYVVVHVNHPREISDNVKLGFAKLVNAGIPLLAQSVLLKGVNNTFETLSALMKMLVSLRVKPYYLHQLDKAKGTEHFRCSIAEGQKLMRALRGQLSGLCLPTYMLDIPGGFGKVPIGPEYLNILDGGHYHVMDIHGEMHNYTEATELRID